MTVNRIASSVLVLMLVTSPAAWAAADAPEKYREKERKEKSVEREGDLYDEGTDALDEKDFARAVRVFRRVARLQGEHADASLYWLSRAQNELGQRAEALATLVELRKAFPKSHWAEDGKALEVEIRQSSGQHVEPDQISDEDVKLMALNGLMGSDPEKALPILEKIISGNSSPRVRERAIFVLSQSHSPRAMDILGRVARDSSRPDLQEKAVRYLGIMGGHESRKVLADVYASTNDLKVKKNILKSYMIAGDRAHLLALAKGEPIVELRGDAVRQLGIIGARNELADLYNTESDVDIRKHIIQAMFIGGSVDKLADIARNEKVPELRATAIRNLGLLGNARTGDLLLSLYESDSSSEVRHAVINSLFLQQNAKALISLARKEKNPELKREIISKLALIRSDEVSNYLMEVLKD
ncbi:MAG TPA: HEAT repeat domain-containing protein [Thermoanaerobaculia bacterium]